MKTFSLVTVFPALILFLSLSLAAAGGQTDADRHERFMRQTFDLAISAGKNGNHTFGALLVHDGKVLMTAENTIYTDENSTHHAETNLMARARKTFPPEMLKESVLYTSAAPCMSCCSAIWYTNIKEVVYGVSYEAFSKVTGMKDKSIPCDRLYHHTDTKLEWVGPVLEKEGLKVFCCWPQDKFRSSILKNLEGCESMEARCRPGRD